MKSFQELMMKHIHKHQLFEAGDLVLVGCSGGIDSMALLHFLNSKKDELGISVGAVHVDHMLRGEESGRDRLFTEATAEEWGVECFSRAIPIPEIWKEKGGNKQQLCRSERYAYFLEVMEQTGADKFATAHHADDQLETILMSGLRGNLQDGSFGIQASRPFGSGFLIRPQLAVTKEQIADYIELHKISYREDSSNREAAYTRNRLRQRVLPLLKKENSNVSQNFVELAEDMQQDQQFLQELAKTKLQQLIQIKEDGIILSAKSFRLEAYALQKRMVLLLLNYLYNQKQVPVTRQLVGQMQEMMQSSAGTVFFTFAAKLCSDPTIRHGFPQSPIAGKNGRNSPCKHYHGLVADLLWLPLQSAAVQPIGKSGRCCNLAFSRTGRFTVLFKEQKTG